MLIFPSYPCIVAVYEVQHHYELVFPREKGTLDPNLVMTLIINKLAAGNITNTTVPPNMVDEDKDRSGNLVDIYYHEEGRQSH